MILFFTTPEYGKSLVQGDYSLDKVVIVYAAHKVSQEVLSNLRNMQTNFEDVTFTKQSNLWTDAGEDKLEQVQDTGARVSPAQILENQIRAEISRLQLSPDGKC